MIGQNCPTWHHFISFHFISFHFISFHFISFHFISFHTFRHFDIPRTIYFRKHSVTECFETENTRYSVTEGLFTANIPVYIPGAPHQQAKFSAILGFLGFFA